MSSTSSAIPAVCPHCQASLIGAPIPQEHREAYGASHGSRAIAIYDRDRDIAVAWKCPDCAQQWLLATGASR